MTPVLDNTTHVTDYATSGMSSYDYPTCECCRNAYNPGRISLQKMKISESYGMAIINEGQPIKVIKCLVDLD